MSEKLTSSKIISVEVSGQFGETPDHLKSSCDTDPDCYKVLAENDEWFAGMMTMEPGAVDHPHGHRDHLLYVLEVIRFASTTWEQPGNNLGPDMSPLEGDEPPAKMTLDIVPGAAMAVPAGHHWLENIDEKTAKIVFFECKK